MSKRLSCFSLKSSSVTIISLGVGHSRLYFRYIISSFHFSINKNKKYNGLKPIKLYFKPGFYNDIKNQLKKTIH